MSKFSEYIGSQFRNPRGLPGIVSCLGMNVINQAMYQKAASLLDIPRGAKVLDIGYGNGYLLKSDGCFYNVLYTKEWLDRLSYTEKGFKKFEAGQLVQLGYEAGFHDVQVQEIRKRKSFVLICKK